MTKPQLRRGERPFATVAIGAALMLGVAAAAMAFQPPSSLDQRRAPPEAPQPAFPPTVIDVAPPAPSIVELHGISVEDEPHVMAFLELNVACRYWTGAYSEHSASVLDLLRLRRMGYASPPFDYELRHEADGEHHYVVVRERVKQRDGSDLPNAPGYVAHRYYFDPPRERFELLDSTPEDPSFHPRMLRALGDPLSFLSLHWDAVCNGRLRLPEVRQALAARAEPRSAAEAAAASEEIFLGREPSGAAPPSASEAGSGASDASLMAEAG